MSKVDRSTKVCHANANGIEYQRMRPDDQLVQHLFFLNLFGNTNQNVFLKIFSCLPFLSPSAFLQALSPSLEAPGSEEVFEDVGNQGSSRSSEGGFTDFIQYQGDGIEQATENPHPMVKTGRRPSSGPTHNKNKPVMQCCLENFQQFLSRLITLYITSCRVDNVGGERDDVMLSGPLVVEGTGHTEPRPVQRECVAAFTAACQLFLECSSFPVYIAEGNLKSTPTQEEPLGRYLIPLFKLSNNL